MLWVTAKNTKNRRITAIGFESGEILVFIIDLETNKIIQKHLAEVRGKGPITKLIFFPSKTEEEEENGKNLKLLALVSLSESIVFSNVLEQGLDDFATLPGSDLYDVQTCACISDLDFDGKDEIVIGTYGEVMLVYKSVINEELGVEDWEQVWKKDFTSPIHGIFETDLTQDGLKELFVTTINSVVIFQHDHAMVTQYLNDKFSKQVDEGDKDKAANSET